MISPFQACFVSYDEPLADALHARAERVLDREVVRVSGVRGMRAAYVQAAMSVDTVQFLLIDADFEFDTSFDRTTIGSLAEGVDVRIWRTRNPLNGLEYGHGGLKLCRRAGFERLDPSTLDVIAGLPGRKEFVGQVAGITRFNQSPFHAWRAAFRECAKLRRGSEYGVSPDDSSRIDAWLQIDANSGQFAEEARRGAVAGVSFAENNPVHSLGWSNLHDLEWLANSFTAEGNR